MAFSDIVSIRYRNTTYNSSNPGPSGWSQTGVGKDFGIRFNKKTIPTWNSVIVADVQDAIEDGIIVIGSAGNDNMYMAEPNDVDWNNYMTWTKGDQMYHIILIEVLGLILQIVDPLLLVH